MLSSFIPFLMMLNRISKAIEPKALASKEPDLTVRAFCYEAHVSNAEGNSYKVRRKLICSCLRCRICDNWWAAPGFYLHLHRIRDGSVLTFIFLQVQ